MPGDHAVALWEALVAGGVAPAGLGARDTLRLEAGMNLYGQDMEEDISPWEANLGWTIAPASMRGTIYYWSNNLGRVLRIKPGAVAPENFLATGNAPAGCTTCHAVSANGSTLIIGGDAEPR